jgi:hypothetical protein
MVLHTSSLICLISSLLLIKSWCRSCTSSCICVIWCCMFSANSFFSLLSNFFVRNELTSADKLPLLRVAQWVRSLDLTTHTSLSPIRRGFAPSFVSYKKGALDLQPEVIKFTSCLPRVGGSLRVLWLPPLHLHLYSFLLQAVPLL